MDKIIKEDALQIASSNYVDWRKLRGKTVLIAGANGYVPQFFVHGLLKRNEIRGDGIKVIALCRDRQKAEERFGAYFKREDFQLLQQDVCAPIDINRKPDFIIHAASPAGIKVTMEHPEKVFRANVTGCENLLKMAAENGARLLYMSSVDVYGMLDEKRWISEEDIGTLNHVGLRSIYAASKRAAETLCMCFEQKGADAVIVRPSQIMGPGIALHDERLHINMISQMMRGNQIVLKGDGTPRRSFIYITDAITGMLAVLTRADKGAIYNICTELGEATVRELAEKLAGLVKDRKIKIVYNMETRHSDPAVRQVVSTVCPSSQKLRGLGWESKVTFTRACQRMMQYYGLEV